MQNFSGLTIQQYHITQQLGHGGMAAVYKAYDTKLDRDVAIKMIRVDELPSDQLEIVRSRFVSEAQLQVRFSHPNIVPVYAFGNFDDIPYLVMAYLPGGTLKERMRSSLSLKSAIRILAPIADALAYAHSLGVVHRDIKPSNILFNSQRQPILTDFGIASLFEAESTKPGMLGVGVGTPAYMAPEQWRGIVLPQTDIYALGVVMFEIITGVRPYTADTPIAVALKQTGEPIPNPRQFAPGLPEPVENFLYKAMAKDPDNRFSSMAELKVALLNLAALSPQSSPSASTLPLPSRFNLPDSSKEKNVPAGFYKSTPIGTQIEPEKSDDRSQKSTFQSGTSNPLESEKEPVYSQPQVQPIPKPTPSQPKHDRSIADPDRDLRTASSSAAPTLVFNDTFEYVSSKHSAYETPKALESEKKVKDEPVNTGIGLKDSSGSVRRTKPRPTPMSIGTDPYGVRSQGGSAAPLTKATDLQSFTWLHILFLAFSWGIAHMLKSLLATLLVDKLGPEISTGLGYVVAWSLGGLVLALVFRKVAKLSDTQISLLVVLFAFISALAGFIGSLNNSSVGWLLADMILWGLIGLVIGFIFVKSGKLKEGQPVLLAVGWALAGVLSSLTSVLMLDEYLTNLLGQHVGYLSFGLVEGLILGLGLGIATGFVFVKPIEKEVDKAILLALAWTGAFAFSHGLYQFVTNSFAMIKPLANFFAWFILIGLIFISVRTFFFGKTRRK